VYWYTKWMTKFLFRLYSIGIATAFIFASGATALAAKPAPAPAPAPTPLGNDISWPQCGKTLPKGQAFGVVGVNNGLANTSNPCFASELSWAQKSVGGTGQDKVALYVNTANPGLTGSWWPTSNTYAGTTVDSQYGTCDGSDSAACAYVYGYAKAYDDANVRGVANPSGYLWWLDVETGNSWETNKAANTADLEGMTAYFQSIGARVGIYSTSSQWGQIAGVPSSTSNLRNLLSWIPGARSQSSAQAYCSLAPLTPGSTVTMTQFVSKNLDYDFSCI
jgi:hypothetical protein